MRTKPGYAMSARLGDAADEVAGQNVREELRGRRDRGPAAGWISFARPARWVVLRGLAGALGQPDGSPSGAALTARVGRPATFRAALTASVKQPAPGGGAAGSSPWPTSKPRAPRARNAGDFQTAPMAPPRVLRRHESAGTCRRSHASACE